MNIFYKFPDKKYYPRWSAYVSALAMILEGFLQLFTVPFGYGVSISSIVSEWRIKYAFRVKNHEKI